MRINTLKVGMSLFLAAILLTVTSSVWLNSPLRVMATLPPKILLNQVGYGPTWQKQAFLLNGGELDNAEVAVIDRTTGQSVLKLKPQGSVSAGSMGDRLASHQESAPRVHLQILDFSAITKPGKYILQTGALQSAPFIVGQAPYQSALTQLLRSYYLQRCGVAIHDPVTGIHHAPCHVKDGAIAHADRAHSEGQTIAAAGGWHDAGDYGKYTSTAAITIGRLLSLYEQSPTQFKDAQLTIPESGNGIPDLLDEMQVGLDWLLTQQRSDGAVYRKLSGRQWPNENAPDEDQQPRYVYGMTTPETAKFAAVMAMAGRVYQPLLPKQAERYINAATHAWQFLQSQPTMQVDWVDGDDSGSGKYLFSDIDNEESLKTDEDDRLWAAAELSITLHQPQFEQYFAAHLNKMDYTLFEWKDPSSLGMVDYLLQREENRAKPALKRLIQAKLLARADNLLQKTDQNPYRLANARFIWGSNKMAAEEGITLAYAYQLTHDSRYLNAARDQAHFILGRNPFNQTFVSGVGANPVKNVNHLFARVKKIYIPGLLVGGPNSGAQDGIAPKNLGVLSYVDNAKSYATNEYAIDYNASFITLIALSTNAIGD
jgi:endoglucanase